MRTINLTTVVYMAMLLAGLFIIPAAPSLGIALGGTTQGATPDEIDVDPDNFPNEVMNYLSQDTEPGIPADYDIGLVLQDNPNHYKTIFEPWKTKAAIHAIAYHEATGFLALGGGYLYDNEVHIWRLNTETGMFDKVWDSGDSILRADVISLAWGDTDLNDFLEVVAASSDGFVYVFEQRHIYDPYANTENMFDHVWTSPYTFRAFDVKIYDADRDYREDIIVGSWDGKVRCFEYDNHSGYPFAEEHWITYRKVWDSGDSIEGRVYTLAYGDTNFNGLPEIIAGTREGRVYIFENDGVHLMINGEPFPLINDNHYRLVWTSENYTWRPIISMEVGELDGTDGEEIALVAQGQGVFVLDWNELSSTFNYNRIYRGWDAWQTDEESPWRLDFWADSILSANNVTFQLANGTIVNEPIVYEYIGAGLFDPPAQCYPYNTGLANATDFYYSIFNAGIAPNATAIVDFGKDEEGTGSASAKYDLRFRFQSSISLSKIKIGVGQSTTDFERIESPHLWTFMNYLYVDVDTALGARNWDWFRYVNISVYGGVTYRLDSIELMQVYNQITSALTVAIGPLPTTFNLFGPPNEPNRLIITTVIGNFYAYGHNETTLKYDLLWDSSRDDFFKLDTNVWDMVYVGHETRIPIWLIGGIQYQMPLSGTFRHWTIGDLYQWDWVGAMNPHEMIVIDSNNQFLVYKTSPNPFYTLVGLLEEDIIAGSYFANIETAVGTNPATVEMVMFDLLAMPVAVVGTYDLDITLDEKYGLGVGGMNADIRFYHRAGPEDPFLTSGVQDAGDVDDTGDIVVALSNAKAVPRMKFVDWDGDGDLDLILSTGFLYYCENIGIPSGWNVPRYRMHKGYFDTMNSGDSMNDYWGQPEVWDIDQDGDLDLILSYDTRAGATCWLNKGTSDEPVWVQNKKLFSNTRPETNLKYNSFTNIRMVPYNWNLPQDFWKSYNDEMVTLADAEYSMMAYKTDTETMSVFWPVYDQSASYVLATYPTVYRYEFAIQNEGAYNFGYHATESWSTEADLADWTLTVRSDDVDDDGKGEIIVGDYDNNIYIFEHMVNNTYKRAFRSFDINHTELSDSSPYMWEELEGISGTFNRVIWDHVTHLVAGCDLDNDGYKELIAAAGLQVYVFEDTGIDDTYDLVYMIDLRHSGFTETAGWTEDTVITAMGAGDDYDLNGERELVVAAGPFLFVYNIGYDSWTRFNEYFMESKSLDGRYYLIGNGAEEDYREASIEALTLCDTDEDGLREIILGGRVNTTQMREDGFLKIYEWQGANFEEVWEAPPEVTYWNPVTSIVLDDQDYDSKQEIIIGHTQGFDIWEYRSGDNAYRKVDVVTSSPNYPIVPLASTYVAGETHGLTGRGDSDLAYLWNLNDNIILSVFCHMNELWWKLYSVPLKYWTPAVDLITMSYPGYIGGTALEYEPSLFLHENGSIYLTWKTYTYYSGDFYYDLWSSKIDWQTEQWVTPKLISAGSEFRDYPSLYSIGDSLGIVYTRTTDHRVFYKTLDDWSGSWSPVGYVVNYTNYAQYYVQSCDIIMLPDGGYALAISGRNNTLAKTDLDIFVATCNSSFFRGNSPMYRATTSYSNEVNPDLGLLDAPEETLMVAYESIESPVEDRIQMSYSNTYTIWRQHEPMASLPQSFIRVELPGGGVEYWYNETVKIYAPQALCPSLLGMRGGGFMQMHTFAFFAGVTTPLSPAYIVGTRGPYGRGVWKEGADLLYGINPSSRFTHFNIESVVDMDVGDTDGDGRREVVAGFDEFVGVYELKHSNVGSEVMQHEEVWLSNPMPEPVTGVTVYDSNGNGYEEIGVSCERGEVFVFEVGNTGGGRVPLFHSEDLWSSTIGAAASGGTGAPQVLTYDIDSDGKDEVFRGELNGTVRAYDDDGSQLWSNNDHPEGVFWMEIGPMTPAGTEVFIVVTRSPSTFSDRTNITLINAMTGATHWHNAVRNFVLTPLCIATIGDVYGSTDSEVIVTNTLNDVFVFAWNGTRIYNASTVYAWIGNNIVLGNFSGRANLDIGLVLTNGSLVVLSGNNGTVLFSIGAAMGMDIQKPTAADFNGDGLDEIFLARYNLWVVDSLNMSILYNSTNIFTEVIREVYVADYDNDSILEAILVTDHHAYLEEITSGRIVWSYKYQGDRIEDSGPAVLYNGRQGVALCSHDGAVMGLDGMTGVVAWFAQSSNVYNELVAGDFDGDGLTELGGSEESSGDIYVYNEVEPWIPTPPEAYTPWTQYWNVTFDPSRYFRISGLWTYDVDSDGITEAVIADSFGVLRLFSPVEPMDVWKINLGATVLDVKFANFGGDATVDLLVLATSGGMYMVVGLNGQNGEVLEGLDEEAPAGGRINAIAVGNFRLDIDGTEYAIAYTTSANLTYVCFYESITGGVKYVSAVNATSFYPTHAVVGNWTGDGAEELMLAGITSGTDGDVWSWQGNGALIGSFPAGYPLIADMQSGNLDGDTYTDVAIAWADGVVWSWDVIGFVLWAVDMNATVSSLLLVDVDGTPTDEIVVNTNEEGIIVCDGPAFGEKWRYDALTTVPKKVRVADVKGAGEKDLIIMVEDHIAIVRYSTGDIIGTYTMTDSPPSIYVGNFDNTGNLDLMYYYAGKVYCITDHTTPPMPIPAPRPLVAGSSLLETTIVSAIVGLPIAGIVVSIPMFVRRRKQH